MYEFPWEPHLYDPENIMELRDRILIELGERICSERKRKNDSQQLLANSLGVSNSTISRYENGEIEIPSSVLPIIAMRYRTTVARMFNEISIKGSLSEFDNLNYMIVNTLNSLEENNFSNISMSAPKIADYYSKLVQVKENNSFDMFFLILQLMEKINIIINEKDETNKIQNAHTIFDKFFQDINIMSNNDYEKVPSVFADELINYLGI